MKKKTTKKVKVPKTKKKPVVKKTKIKKPEPVVTIVAAPKRAIQTDTKTNYLSKRELLGAVMESKRIGKMSDDLAFKLQLLTSRYARKANFGRYTFNDDMRAYAMMMLVKTWNSFNPEKSDNPFAFFTQCIKNSFIQYLNQEKRQRTIRDELLVKQGMAPSLTYQMEHEEGIVAQEDPTHTHEQDTPIEEGSEDGEY